MNNKPWPLAKDKMIGVALHVTAQMHFYWSVIGGCGTKTFDHRSMPDELHPFNTSSREFVRKRRIE